MEETLVRLLIAIKSHKEMNIIKEIKRKNSVSKKLKNLKGTFVFEKDRSCRRNTMNACKQNINYLTKFFRSNKFHKLINELLFVIDPRISLSSVYLLLIHSFKVFFFCKNLLFVRFFSILFVQ